MIGFEITDQLKGFSIFYPESLPQKLLELDVYGKDSMKFLLIFMILHR